MKTLAPLAALTLTALLALPAGAPAAPRTVLVEGFTNTSCPYCPGANAVTQQFLDAYGPELALGVTVHVNWPSASDPFYLHNPTDNLARRSYYGINSVPALRVEGAADASPGDYAALAQAADARLLRDSPLALKVVQTSDGANVTVTVGVKAESAPPAGPLVLQMALIEREIYLATPPGSNGERDFFWTLRDLLPDGGGTALSLVPGDSLVFSRTVPIHAAWNYGQIAAVCWVQNSATREVLQAGTSIPRAPYAFFFAAHATADVVTLGQLRSFDAVIHNRGLAADVYDVHIEKDVPASWGASVCANGLCYPPWVTDFTVSVAAGATDTILVDIQPLLEIGTGTVTLTATSRGDPSRSFTRTFKAISSGIPILCVDADGGYAYENYFTAALVAGGRPFAVWDRSSEGALSASLLDRFAVVIWNAGLAYPAVSPADRAALAAYLDGGGRLLISGQDIGWSLCDPTSSDYSAESLAWYQTYLGATYLNDDTNLLTLTGVPGDPIGDGLVLSLSGGDGANNQQYPSEIDARGGAVGFLLYAAGREAAVRHQSGPFKVVYLAFGFEGISTAANRALLMERALVWLGINLVDVPDPAATPAFLAAAPAAWPNPFNPAVTIALAIGGDGAAPAAVEIYDLRGRRVRELWRGPLPAGERRLVWDGRTESGAAAASGVYVARVRVADRQETVKLTLAK